MLILRRLVGGVSDSKAKGWSALHVGEKLVISRSTILLCIGLAGNGEEVSPKNGGRVLDLKKFS